MRNEISIKKVGGLNLIKIRTRIPSAKTFKDVNQYTRKQKHKKRSIEC
jgi:hypothetical protein